MNAPYNPSSSPEILFAVRALNHIFGLRRKLRRVVEAGSIERSIDALETCFRDQWIWPDEGLVMSDPTGEPYSDTRNDCDASIAGESLENLVIVDTLKPIIRLVVRADGREQSIVVQKAAVVVRSREELPGASE